MISECFMSLILKFEKKINYSFKDRSLIENALLHPSFAQSKFELLEFIGDRVVALIVADSIWSISPVNEKAYAYNFVSATNREALLEIGKKMELDAVIQRRGCQSHDDTIIADGCEAVFGAIYLDSDLHNASLIFSHFWSLKKLKPVQEVDPKTCVQNWANCRAESVKYTVLTQAGLPHKMEYIVQLSIGNKRTTSSGSSIKAAEKNAAKLFLSKWVK